MHINVLKTLLGFWFHAKKIILTYVPFCKRCSYISIWGDVTLKVNVVKTTLSSKSQCKYTSPTSSMVLFTIWSKVLYLFSTFASKMTSIIPKSKSSIPIGNLPSFTTTPFITQWITTYFKNKLTTNKWSSKTNAFGKTHNRKGIEKINTTKWKHGPSTTCNVMKNQKHQLHNASIWNGFNI